MGFWPFGGGKKARTSQSEEQARRSLLEKPRTDVGVGGNTSPSQDFATMGRTGQDEKPRRLSKQRLPPQSRNVSRVQTAPIHVRGPGHGQSSGAGPRSPDLYSHNPMSQTSIGPEDFTALPQAPTLLARRPGYDPTLSRKKSSKRKAEDYAREREVRAMSSPLQGLKRPSTYSGSGPLRRDTKHIPGDLNRRLHRPTSEVSLPLPEAMQEGEDLSNQTSFKIGFLAALSPRPSLTSVSDGRSPAGKQAARLKPTIEKAIEEEEPASRKRINELADDLDAGGLRELMERDRKRREKKKETDHARLQRKLQYKADKQREEELRGRRLKDPSDNMMAFSPKDRERRGRDPFDDDAETSEAALAKTPVDVDRRPSDPFLDPKSSPPRPVQTIRNPFEDEKEIEAMHDALEQEDEDPPVPIRSPLRTVPPTQISKESKPLQATTISPPTSPIQQSSDGQNLTQASGPAREGSSEVAEQGSLDRRSSDQSGQQVSVWTSFFRRGGRRKTSINEPGRSTASEFSNTSRESFAARKQQVPPVVIPRSFRQSDASSIPQRTMSKFREDLPELPLSPPDSRVQSPAVVASPQEGSTSRYPRHSTSGPLDNRSLATTSGSAVLDGTAAEALQTQNDDLDTDGAPSAAVLSQSLASVDSEGSWLSGRPSKRLSGPMGHPLRQSQSSIPPQSVPGSFEPEADDLTNDEYLNRLTPGPSGQRDSVTSADRRASSNVIDLEQERQQGPVPEVPQLPATPGPEWHTGVARQPTVVRQATRAKSREGLLNEAGMVTPGGSQRASMDGEDKDFDLLGPTPGSEVQEATLMRAQSVDYKNKGHARHVSAGSARLLDIRRSSMQSEGPPRSPGLPQTVPSTSREQTAFPKE